MSPPIAFSGTREPRFVPAHHLELFLAAARDCARRGIPVHIGGSPGLEQTAARAVLSEGGTVNLFLPRLHFEETWVEGLRRGHGERVTVTIYDPVLHGEWARKARELQPRTSAAVAALAARMCGCLEGCEALFVLPFVRVHRPPPPQGWLGSLFGRRSEADPVIEERGGSGHVIRLARHLGITVVDFSTEEGQSQARNWLDQPTDETT